MGPSLLAGSFVGFAGWEVRGRYSCPRSNQRFDCNSRPFDFAVECLELNFTVHHFRVTAPPFDLNDQSLNLCPEIQK
jgi:hypothetical protein